MHSKLQGWQQPCAPTTLCCMLKYCKGSLWHSPCYKNRASRRATTFCGLPLCTCVKLKHWIEQEIGIWRDIFREIAAQHEKYNTAMVHNYLCKENLALHDICFLFEASDRVLLRSQVTSASGRGESKMPPDPGSCTCSPAHTFQGVGCWHHADSLLQGTLVLGA